MARLSSYLVAFLMAAAAYTVDAVPLEARQAGSYDTPSNNSPPANTSSTSVNGTNASVTNSTSPPPATVTVTVTAPGPIATLAANDNSSYVIDLNKSANSTAADGKKKGAKKHKHPMHKGAKGVGNGIMSKNATASAAGANATASAAGANATASAAGANATASTAGVNATPSANATDVTARAVEAAAKKVKGSKKGNGKKGKKGKKATGKKPAAARAENLGESDPSQALDDRITELQGLGVRDIDEPEGRELEERDDGEELVAAKKGAKKGKTGKKGKTSKKGKKGGKAARDASALAADVDDTFNPYASPVDARQAGASDELAAKKNSKKGKGGKKGKKSNKGGKKAGTGAAS